MARIFPGKFIEQTSTTPDGAETGRDLTFFDRFTIPAIIQWNSEGVTARRYCQERERGEGDFPPD